MDWSEFQHSSVDGAFRLQDCVSANGTAAIFSARLLDQPNATAVIRMRLVEDRSAADKQLSLWRSARSFTHPNLIRVLAAGRVEAGQTSFIYVALEPAEEGLATVLTGRTLGPKEVEDVARSVLSALDFLHGKGYVHSSVSPEQIFAVGDAIKLSTEGIVSAGSVNGMDVTAPKYLAPEGKGANTTAASDVWCLGATIYEALTGEVIPDAGQERLRLQSPFEAVVDRCLEAEPRNRCSLAEAGELLSGKVVEKEKAAAATAGATAPARPIEIRPEPVRLVEPARLVETPKPIELPKAAEAPRTIRPEPPKTLYPAARKKSSVPLWIYGAGLVAILIAVIALFRSRPTRKVSEHPPAASAGTQAAANTKTIGPDTETVAPAVRREKPNPGVSAVPRTAQRKSVAAASSPASKSGSDVWRVIVYTYGRREDAEKKAQAINQANPNLHAAAFSPNGASPYLVVLGDAADRDAAKQLRQDAISAGLPRDSYVQNFSR